MKKTTKETKLKSQDSEAYRELLNTVDIEKYSEAVIDYAILLLKSRDVTSLSTITLTLSLNASQRLLTARNLMQKALADAEKVDTRLIASSNALHSSALGALRTAGLAVAEPNSGSKNKVNAKTSVTPVNGFTYVVDSED